MIYAIFMCVAGVTTCQMAQPPRRTMSGTFIPGIVYASADACEQEAARLNSGLDPRRHAFVCFERAAPWQATR